MSLYQEFCMVIILSASVLISWCAVMACLCILEVGKLLRKIGNVQMKTFAMAFAVKVQSDCERICSMRKELEFLIEHDEFEEAQRLKKTIDELEKNVNVAIEHLNKFFGEHIEECKKQ